MQGTAYDSRTRPELLRLPTLTRNAALAEENAEVWLYIRIAFLYFLAMIIYWIPASINRLVSVIKPDDVIFGLNYAAIYSLPLQGFLNGLVYYVSSQTAMKNLFRRSTGPPLRRSPTRPAKDAQRISDSYPSTNRDGQVVFRDWPLSPSSRPGSRRPSDLHSHPHNDRSSNKNINNSEASTESIPLSKTHSMQRQYT